MPSQPEQLRARTKEFALNVLRLCQSLPRNSEAQTLGRQLLRSGTSVAANHRAACRARSKAEFIAKIGVVLEEADETTFWPELLRDGQVITAEHLHSLLAESEELTRIFSASRRTAKES
jgi:four helix bundle protein